MKSRKIVVGMSGGVDSSISVLLLKKQGWDVVGVSLKLAHWKNKSNILGENACCTAESLDIAENVCKKLGVPYYKFDVSKEFKRDVMDYFVSELKHNRTPNPCVICNRYIKFRKLFEWAKKHSIKHVATGHYARIRFNTHTKEYELLRPKDLNKDQTYGLSWLPQKWLKYIVLPLADYTKDEVYQLAKKQGFEIFLKRKQSQDLCFVSGRAYPKYLEEKVGKRPGPIKDEKGNVLGKHDGLHFYTIGQRKGVGLRARYYVKDRDFKTNSLIVTKNKKDINSKELILSPFSFISGKPPRKEKIIQAKPRYCLSPSKATLFPPEDGKIRVVFDVPQPCVAPGQFCVLYDKEVCLGAGVIN